jgi:hypothetical protein
VKKEKRELFMILVASISMVSMVAFGINHIETEKIHKRQFQELQNLVPKEPLSLIVEEKSTTPEFDGNFILKEIVCFKGKFEKITSRGEYKFKEERLSIKNGKIRKTISSKKDKCELLETMNFREEPNSNLIFSSNHESRLIKGDVSCEFSNEIEASEGKIRNEKVIMSEGKFPTPKGEKRILFLPMGEGTFMILSLDHLDGKIKGKSSCFYVYVSDYT